MIDKRIIVICANPRTVGGVASLIRATIDAEIYSNALFLHPHNSGSILKKLSALIVSISLFVGDIIFRRPKFVHIHTSSYNSFKRKYVFIFLCGLFGIDYVLHIHGGSFIKFYDECNDSWKNRIRRSLEKANIQISVSPQFKNEICERFKINKAIVIPNFISPLKKVSLSIKASELKKERLSFLFLADISDSKGFEDAVKLIMALSSSVSYIHLNCAGAMDKSYFDDVLKRNNAQKYVSYCGFISGHIKQKFIEEAFFLVSPSKIETFGMSNLESALLGTPVLGYSVGGVPSVISSGDNGFLVDEGDWASFIEIVSKYIGDSESYYKLQQQCYLTTRERFSLENIEKYYFELYS